MKNYSHTQRASLLIVVMVAICLMITAAGLLWLRPLMALVPVLSLVTWLFHSLTIEISSDALRWRFGPGLIRKHVPVRDIASVHVVRTNILEGWGIHFSRFGWLYNVSGFDAVAITLRNGRRFALGTDEPEILARQLRSFALPD